MVMKTILLLFDKLVLAASAKQQNRKHWSQGFLSPSLLGGTLRVEGLILEVAQQLPFL